MTIRQQITFDCSAKQLFSILTEANKFSQITASEAVFDLRVGGEFSAFNGMISGRFIELEHDKRLSQRWRAANWQDGVYSLISFNLQASTEHKTTLSFEQTEYPVEFERHLAQGWQERYWQPIKKYLAGSSK